MVFIARCRSASHFVTRCVTGSWKWTRNLNAPLCRFNFDTVFTAIYRYLETNLNSFRMLFGSLNDWKMFKSDQDLVKVSICSSQSSMAFFSHVSLQILHCHLILNKGLCHMYKFYCYLMYLQGFKAELNHGIIPHRLLHIISTYSAPDPFLHLIDIFIYFMKIFLYFFNV